MIFGFGTAAQAADPDGKPTVRRQVEKLRAQAERAHKEGDALTAKAEKLEAEAEINPGEKMRGGLREKPEKSMGGGHCVSDAGVTCSIQK